MEKKTNWKKIIELVIVILTAIGSFIGGNASAKNGFHIFKKFNKLKLLTIKILKKLWQE